VIRATASMPTLVSISASASSLHSSETIAGVLSCGEVEQEKGTLRRAGAEVRGLGRSSGTRTGSKGAKSQRWETRKLEKDTGRG
jgi:hypothetical protein